MAAVVFLLGAGAWGAMQAVATETTGVSAVEPQGEALDTRAPAQVERLARKVRGPQDKLDFVNYRRTWRTYYA